MYCTIKKGKEACRRKRGGGGVKCSKEEGGIVPGRHG
jgi:hypothetical protein